MWNPFTSVLFVDPEWVLITRIKKSERLDQTVPVRVIYLAAKTGKAAMVRF